MDDADAVARIVIICRARRVAVRRKAFKCAARAKRIAMVGLSIWQGRPGRWLSESTRS
jgi:hypothetical protein